MADGVFAEIVYDAVVGAVLFVDLQDAAVFGVAGGKYARWFAGQKDSGVGAVTVGEAANDEHAVEDARKCAKRECAANKVRVGARGGLRTDKAGPEKTRGVPEVCAARRRGGRLGGREMIKKIWAQHWFVCLLPVAFALAWFVPEIASKGGWSRPEVTTKFGVGLIFVLQGLALPMAALRAGVGQWRLHAVVQVMTYVGLPVIGLALAALAGRWLSDELRIGLVFLAVLPSTVSSAAVLTANAGGNTAGAIFNAVLSSLLGVVLTPALLAVALSLQGVGVGAGGGAVDAGTVIVELVKLIILPLVVGQVLRLRLADWAGRHKKRLSTLSMSVILFIVFAAFCDAAKAEVWTRYGAALPLQALVIAVALFVAATAATRAVVRAAKLGRGDAIAAEFCAVQKTLASGVPLAGVVFAGDPRTGLILLPLLIYHPLQLTLHGALAARRARESAAAEILTTDITERNR